jgi:tRNA A-37 threonylcarbamoyl transferase component Bud32
MTAAEEPLPATLERVEVPSPDTPTPVPDMPRSKDLLLVFLSGSLAGQSFEFHAPCRVVIGRAKGCDIEVFDRRVSRQHCSVHIEGPAPHVKDLGSANGTRLNGREVALAAIASGDILRLADTEVRIELAEATETIKLSGAPTVRPKGLLRNRDLKIDVPGFELTGVLGEGATSAVFKARRDNGEVVAIKVHKLSDALEPEERERFLREAETAASLVHPNVVRTLEHGAVEGRHYIVMEFVRGETLRARLQRLGAMPVPVALHVARQIASALDFARQKDLVHRDVKPENILVQEDGVAKLADFGLAKSVLTAGRSGVTRTGEVLGTLAYMSPEQLDSSVSADHRADIYSLGATLYHMIAGRTPFSARTNMEYFAKVLHEEPPILGLLRRDVPPIVSALVARCMRKRPEDRYQSAEDIERLASQLLATSEDRTTTY